MITRSFTQFIARKGIKTFVFITLLTTLLSAGLVSAGAPSADPTLRPEYRFGNFPFYPRFIGLPQNDVIDTILPGWTERGRANLELAQDLYNEQRVLQQFPGWKNLLAEHPGYWPELVGKLGDNNALRMFGPDVWKAKDGGYVVGEENGANVGGNETMMGVLNEIKKHPEWGITPHNSDYFRRLGNELRAATGGKVIVYADEASVRSEGYTEAPDGKTFSEHSAKNPLQLPFVLDQGFRDLIANSLEEAGITWVSLIDERGRVFVENGAVYLRSKDGKTKTKVDVLITAADLESIDPLHKPQWERNKRVHRGDLNDVALVLGIPGLIDTWVSNKGSFVWMNNPTSTLTRSKLWPVLVDQFIEAKSGRKPILPIQDTIVFFDSEGRFLDESMKRVTQDPDRYVFKMTLGDGGKQVWIGDSDPAFNDENGKFSVEKRAKFLREFEQWGRSNPFSVLAQPYVALEQVEITWPHAPSEKESRVFDVRMIGLIGMQGTASSSKPTDFFTVINRNMMCRMAKRGGLKVNISGGGMIGVGFPADVEKVTALKPLKSIGAREVTFPHTLNAKDYSKLMRDSANRARVEAALIRDIYTNPEALYKRFPILKHLVEGSVYYNPAHFAGRNTQYPSMHISGPDYMENEKGEYMALEHNTTNIGGLFRLWRKGMTDVTQEMRNWINRVKVLDKAEKPFTVYFLEQTELGAPWKALRKKFKKQFGVELVSASEKERFSMQGDNLHFLDSTGTVRKVTSLVLHIEPDFVDSEAMPFNTIEKAVGTKRAEELREHDIPGIGRAIKAGNLLIVNEPGQDISCSKAILPLMPALQHYYLGIDREVVPTIPSENFIDNEGNLRTDLMEQVAKTPANFVIKNGELTGGGGGVYILRENSQAEVAKILELVSKNPEQFILQKAITPAINTMGFHTEVRIISLAEVSMNSTEPARLVGQIPVPYARGANGMSRVNILPTGESEPGYRVPVRITSCKDALK